LYGPLFFGFSSGFRAMAESLPSEVDTLVVRMERVPYIDQSGLYALEDTILRLTQEGKKVVVTGLQTQPADMLRRIKLVPDLIPDDRVFETFATWRQASRSSET
jgi:SulP family sulfate permease